MSRAVENGNDVVIRAPDNFGRYQSLSRPPCAAGPVHLLADHLADSPKSTSAPTSQPWLRHSTLVSALQRDTADPCSPRSKVSWCRRRTVLRGLVQDPFVSLCDERVHRLLPRSAELTSVTLPTLRLLSTRRTASGSPTRLPTREFINATRRS